MRPIFATESNRSPATIRNGAPKTEAATSAAELNVLSLGEMVLAPIWVWLAFNELPSGPTLLGGVVLLLAILLQAAQGGRGRSLAEGAARAPARGKLREAWFGWGALSAGLALIALALQRWLSAPLGS